MAESRCSTGYLSVAYCPFKCLWTDGADTLECPSVEACPYDGLTDPDDGIGNVTDATAADRFEPIIGGKQLKVHHDGSVTGVWVLCGQER